MFSFCQLGSTVPQEHNVPNQRHTLGRIEVAQDAPDPAAAGVDLHAPAAGVQRVHHRHMCHARHGRPEDDGPRRHVPVGPGATWAGSGGGNPGGHLVDCGRMGKSPCGDFVPAGPLCQVRCPPRTLAECPCCPSLAGRLAVIPYLLEKTATGCLSVRLPACLCVCTGVHGLKQKKQTNAQCTMNNKMKKMCACLPLLTAGALEPAPCHWAQPAPALLQGLRVPLQHVVLVHAEVGPDVREEACSASGGERCGHQRQVGLPVANDAVGAGGTVCTPVRFVRAHSLQEYCERCVIQRDGMA